MDFRGAATKATERDIAIIADELGVPYFRLRGVIQVEAPKGPFDRKGRPTMLFEPYQFYKRLPVALRKAAVADGCALARRPKRGEYPTDSYPVLAKAMAFDEAIALQCCSWGRGQVMGFNFKLAGFASVSALVAASMDSEAKQLRAMANFIKAAGLVKHLKSGNAEGFAEGYNGEGYARDGYHTKIRKAWAEWEKKPVPTVAQPAPAAAPAPLPAITDKATVEFVQQRLRDLNYTEVGNVDGRVGDMTAGAIRIFRADNGLPAGDRIDADVLIALGRASPRKLADARVNATPAQVRQAVPEARANWKAKVGSAVMGFPAAALAFSNGVLSHIDSAKSFLEPARDLLSDVPPWAWALAVAVAAAFIFRAGQKGEAASVEAVQTGARR